MASIGVDVSAQTPHTASPRYSATTSTRLRSDASMSRLIMTARTPQRHTTPARAAREDTGLLWGRQINRTLRWMPGWSRDTGVGGWSQGRGAGAGAESHATGIGPVSAESDCGADGGTAGCRSVGRQHERAAGLDG